MEDHRAYGPLRYVSTSDLSRFSTRGLRLLATYRDWAHNVEYVACHIFHIQALHESAAQQGLLEHRQEGTGVLREREGGVGYEKCYQWLKANL